MLAVTAADLAAAGAGVVPHWFSETTVQQLITMPAFMAAPSAYAGLRAGPVDWLLAWIDQPAPSDIRTVARAVPMFLIAGVSPVTVPDDMPLDAAARAVLLAHPLPQSGSRQVHIWRSGACAMAIEPVGALVSTAVVLDDRDGVLDAAHAESWQQWLRLSNALLLRDWPTTITTTSLSGAPTVAPAPTPAETEVALPPAWAEAYAAASTGNEREIILTLADLGDVTPPEIGVEGPDGIPVDISWPMLRVAVAMPSMPAEDHARPRGRRLDRRRASAGRNRRRACRCTAE